MHSCPVNVFRFPVWFCLILWLVQPARGLSNDVQHDAGAQRPAASVNRSWRNEFAGAFVALVQGELTDSTLLSPAPGAAVAVVSDTGTIWRRTAGYLQPASDDPVTDQTLFSIQSMSKSFTALGVLTAVRDGLLDLDTPIEAYLPDFSVQSRFTGSPQQQITLRHLLSHWSGLAHRCPIGGQSDEDPHSFTEHIEAIQDSWLRYPVGHRWSYSNLGVDLAGWIVQERSGLSFPEYMDRHVLRPLGMASSTFDFQQISQHTDRARGRQTGVDTPPLPIPMVPSGGLYTSIDDMSRYLRFFLNSGTIDGRRLIDEALMGELLDVAFAKMNSQHGYALGWWKEKAGPFDCFYHAGAGFGFSSGMIFYPQLSLGVIVLLNSEDNDFNLAGLRGKIEQLITDEFGERIPGAHHIDYEHDPKISVHDSLVAKIVGFYKGNRGARELKIHHDSLWIGMGDEFYNVDCRLKDGCVVGSFGKYSELAFCPHDDDKPGLLTIRNRRLDLCHFFDYNFGPGDRPGPNMDHWSRYLGDYYLTIAEESVGPFQAANENGYLHFHHVRCLEYRPGLFFSCDGIPIEFTDSTACAENMVFRKQ